MERGLSLTELLLIWPPGALQSGGKFSMQLTTDSEFKFLWREIMFPHGFMPWQKARINQLEKLEAARSAYLWLPLVTLLGVTGRYLALLGLTWPYLALLSLTGPYLVLLILIGSYLALLCICWLTNVRMYITTYWAAFAANYLALLSLTGPYWALLSLT